MDFLFQLAFDCIPPKVNCRAKPWLAKHQNWGGTFPTKRCSFAHQNTKHSTVLHGDVVLGEWDGGGGI